MSTTILPSENNSMKTNVSLERRRSIIREFALNTSTHGLPGIARSHSVHNRIFWSISTCIFIGIACFFVTRSVLDYFRYPKQTLISVELEWPFSFPAVTFCNTCPVRVDRFAEELLKNQLDIDLFKENYAFHLRTLIQSKLRNNESLEKFFFSLADMLITCRFNGIQCSSLDFTVTESPSYGACYTFNGKKKLTSASPVKNSNEDGGIGIFELELYVPSHLYLPTMIDGIGLMLMIHDNQQFPLVEIAGMGMEPGRRHRLTFKRETMEFLGRPYTNCTDNITPAMQALYDRYNISDYRYSQILCLATCIQAFNYNQCGCIDPRQWLMRSVNIFGTDTIVDAPLCNFTDSCYQRSADHIMKDYALLDTWCGNCGVECKTIQFRTTTSSLRAPLDWRLNDIRRFVEGSSMPLPSDWSTAWQSYVRSNYLAVEIVRETIQTTKLTQDPTLSGVDLLSNVGGHSGLWIGISFLTLMEFIEMFYRLIRANIRIVRNGMSKNQTSSMQLEHPLNV